MLHRILQLTLLLTLTLTQAAAGPQAEITKENLASSLVRQTMDRWHYAKPVIDDDFSQRAFGLLTERIDYNKRFFLQSDIDSLQNWEYLMDDELNSNSTEFYHLIWNLWNQRAAEVQEEVAELLENTVDLKSDVRFETSAEKRSFPQNRAERKELWKNIIRQNVLYRYDELAREKAGDSDRKYRKYTRKIRSRILKDAVEKARKTITRRLQRVIDQNENNKLSLYLNSYTNSFDPHTTYFTPEADEDFDIRMTGRLEGIGARLQEDDGYIKVSEIIPGSACWRQGDLEINDLIIKAAEDNEPPTELVEMGVREAVKYIRGPKGSTVHLTVKKTNGSVIEIPIVRDVVLIEETYAKSTVIINENTGDRIGYIDLPKFYHDFQKNGAQNAAEDVQTELISLKEQNVEGIILDLRSNSGGSLAEAVNMAGLFIDKGPVVQVKTQMNRIKIHQDMNEGIVYDGPVIVLVSKISASASEILAAALQDYHRAVIVGPQNTFGKGTVQNIVELDRWVNPKLGDYLPIGTLKLTIQKYYRIDGGSTQFKGVVPDVIIPDTYSYMEIGEDQHEYPLPWDTIQPADYDAWDIPNDHKTLQKLSLERIQSSKQFDLLNERNDFFKQRRENTDISLNFGEYFDRIKELDELQQKYEDVSEELDHIQIVDVIDLDSIEDQEIREKKENRLEEWHKGIKGDIVLDEAMNIMHDLLEITLGEK